MCEVAVSAEVDGWMRHTTVPFHACFASHRGISSRRWGLQSAAGACPVSPSISLGQRRPCKEPLQHRLPVAHLAQPQRLGFAADGFNTTGTGSRSAPNGAPYMITPRQADLFGEVHV
jgi:hypothetical protein